MYKTANQFGFRFQPKTGNPSELTMEMRNEIPQGELFPVTFFLEKSSSVGVDATDQRIVR
jgi:hypothetical protein